MGAFLGDGGSISAICSPTVISGFRVTERVLKDEGDAVATQFLKAHAGGGLGSCGRGTGYLPPTMQTGGSGHRRPSRERAVTRFAGADSPTMPRASPGRKVELYVVGRPCSRSSFGREVGLEVADAEDRQSNGGLLNGASPGVERRHWMLRRWRDRERPVPPDASRGSTEVADTVAHKVDADHDQQDHQTGDQGDVGRHQQEASTFSQHGA